MPTSLVFSRAKTGTTTVPKKDQEPKTNTVTTIAKCNSCNKK